jgi:hypothetical protein
LTPASKNRAGAVLVLRLTVGQRRHADAQQRARGCDAHKRIHGQHSVSKNFVQPVWQPATFGGWRSDPQRDGKRGVERRRWQRARAGDADPAECVDVVRRWRSRNDSGRRHRQLRCEDEWGGVSVLMPARISGCGPGMLDVSRRTMTRHGCTRRVMRRRHTAHVAHALTAGVTASSAATSMMMRRRTIRFHYTGIGHELSAQALQDETPFTSPASQ